MSNNLLTLDQVAEQLQLHVKTVRRYVREGRLPATRVGKSYRVAAEDLAAFAGLEDDFIPGPTDRTRRVENNVVLDVTAISADDASRISNTIMAALQGDHSGLRADTLYYEESARLKIILHGTLPATTHLLRMLDHLLEEA